MLSVTLEGITAHKAEFEQAGVELPRYDVAKVQAETAAHPVWVHCGAGNIFRGFVASLQQDLLNQGLQTSGIQTVSCYDGAIIDEVYKPHDHLTMEVTLLPDKSVKLRVIGSVTDGLKLNGSAPADEAKAREIFRSPSLQMFSYTITEKGYALRGIDGEFTAQVKDDMANGPDKCRHAMAQTTALLFERFKAGAYPIAVVSMDNCSHNGDKVKDAVLTIAKAWQEKGFVGADFMAYLTDGKKVSFPCTMIDKITPRPDPEIAALLKEKGIDGMDPLKTARGSFIAPFVNAEKPQYLVVEDDFPNGRPPLEKAGVLFTTKDGVDLCERMKVTTCLNPLHTALAVYGCVLGYERISAEMDDADLVKLVKKLGYDEGLPVVDDPKILSPKAFLTEVIEERLTNKCLPDSPQRIATDTSQKVPVRFGETLKNYHKKGLDASQLVALPLAIAGWIRYLLAIDDKGQPFTPSDDPLLADLQQKLAAVKFGDPSSVGDNLQPILKNATLFGVDLYAVGLGKKIEGLVGEMIAGPGAVRATLQKYL
ncbi:MAG: mannitol dehydrogenase family protein [Candidatus Anaerobiospirillum merdipullorum]|uniref:Mannitol dehydrogenase family protein n=1 Tax=Candidatus Anaerobiospirillum merdipullorum TaxID=2838450 RepID=A0A9E2KN77_9GAMM|nr:mannitol dehydrogenase family protein [Candidatus Anaerobiospirillum merdipullorum]